MSGLAAQLFREVRPDFFRVLTGPLARLSVESLDAPEHEAAQRNNCLGRDEALTVVEQHADLSAEEGDPLAKAVTVSRGRTSPVGPGWVARHAEIHGVTLQTAARCDDAQGLDSDLQRQDCTLAQLEK